MICLFFNRVDTKTLLLHLGCCHFANVCKAEKQVHIVLILFIEVAILLKFLIKSMYKLNYFK